ncbi:MAG: GNAT family N-acetyltransferase [Gaiellaceae bacterium]
MALVDGGELLAEAHAVLLPWDGSLHDLPSGWEEGFVRGMTSAAPPTALMALAISVAPARQGQRLSSRMIESFKANAGAAGLRSVIAPVRPTLKERYPLIPIERYPLIPIERYVEWRRADGSHFDSWVRIHEYIGGEILGPAPESMTLRAPVADWEEWTEMQFPEDGEYIFPGGLAPLVVRDGIGVHVEPNVWIVHRVAD